MRFAFVLSFLVIGCTYDEECTDVVKPEPSAPSIVLERCGLRHCAKVDRNTKQYLAFRLPDEAGTYRLEDLRGEACTFAGSGQYDCEPVTGSIVVRAVTSPAEHNPVGRLDADVTTDDPSVLSGPTTLRYSERWGRSCYDVVWPDISRL